MADKPNSSLLTPKPAPSKPKGSASQPRRQFYFPRRGSRPFKRWTELWTAFKGRARLTCEERDALAYFTLVRTSQDS